jgi:uncharacterized protein
MIDPNAKGGGVSVGNGEPLVVDWPATARANLEVAMHDGIAVVSFRPTGLEVLTNCHVEGSYGYVGTTVKEQLVRLESADEVKANLPLGGLGIAAKIGGEFEQGAVVDVALMMVGKFRTTRRNATKMDLVGDCANATHMVRGAIVGAFALDKGTKMKARAAVEVFGVGAGGGTASTSGFRQRDGNVGDCQRANPDSSLPPGQCSALVRLELAELGQSAKATNPSGGPLPDAQDESTSCPAGMVMVEGKCASASSVGSHECSGQTADECATECKGGNIRSCTKLAQMAVFGSRGAKRSPVDAAKLFKASCERGDARACGFLGQMLNDPRFTGGKPDVETGNRFLSKSCDQGDPVGCEGLAQAYLFSRGFQRDPQTAAKYYLKSCSGGNRDSCSALGVLLMGGNGLNKDYEKAGKILIMACQGDSAQGCENLAGMIEMGLGTQRDPDKATKLYAKACSMNDNNCEGLAVMKQLGKGTDKNPTEAVSLYRKACGAGSTTACAFLRAYVDPSVTFNVQNARDGISVWKGLCSEGVLRNCTTLATILVSLGEKKDGLEMLQKTCRAGDDWACSNANLEIKAK